MKHHILAALFVILTPLYAESTYFIPTLVGASATSLSQGSGSLLTSAASLFENPSSMDTTHTWQTAAFYTQLLGELTYQNIAIAKNNGHWWGGVGVMRLSAQGIPLTEETTVGNSVEVVQTGNYSYLNELVKLGGGFNWKPHLALGAALTGYRTEIHTTTGQGLNGSLGATYHHPINGFRAGLTIHNIFPFLGVSYSHGETETLPLRVQLSAEKTWGMADLIVTATNSDTMPRPLGALGVAYRPSWIGELIVFRASYREIEVNDTFETAWVLGVDLKLAGLGVNYAWESSDAPDTQGHHYVSFTLALGQRHGGNYGFVF